MRGGQSFIMPSGLNSLVDPLGRPGEKLYKQYIKRYKFV
jgi:hypothetical protein